MRNYQNQARRLLCLLALLFLIGGCGDSQNYVFTGTVIEPPPTPGTIRVSLDVADVNAQIVPEANSFDVTLYAADLTEVAGVDDSTQRTYDFTNLAAGSYLIRVEAFDAADSRVGYFDRVVFFDGTSQTLVFDTLRYSTATPPAPAFPTATTPDFLAFASIPAELGSGQNFSLTVLAFNADGSRDTAATGTVTLSALAGTFQSAPASVALSNGSATFSNLALAITPGQTFVQFRASATGFDAADTPAIDFTNIPVPSVAVVSTPNAPVVGQPFTIQVELLDADGDRVVTATDNVTIAVASAPAGGTLSGTATVAAVNGLATFSNLSVNTAGAYTFTVSAPGYAAITTAPVNVVVNPNVLGFIAPPNNVVVATPFSIQVEALNGADRSTAVVPVTVAIASGPAGATLGGTTTVNTVDGLATFSNLTVSAAGTYTLAASSPTFDGATSPSFVVTATPIPRLEFGTAPTNLYNEDNFTLTVNVLEGNGTPETDPVSVTLALYSGPQGGTLSGTTTVVSTGGVATFSNLQVSEPGNYVFSAAATSYQTVTSTSLTFQENFNIVVGHLSADPLFSNPALGIFRLSQLAMGANDVVPAAQFGPVGNTAGAYDLEINADGSLIWVTANESDTIELYANVASGGITAAIKTLTTGADRLFYTTAYNATDDLLVADVYDVNMATTDIVIYDDATATATVNPTGTLLGLGDFDDNDGDEYDAYVYGIDFDETRGYLYVAQAHLNIDFDPEAIRLLRFNVADLPTGGASVAYQTLNPVQIDLTTSTPFVRNIDYVPSQDRLYLTGEGGLQFLDSVSTLTTTGTTTTLNSTTVPMVNTWDVAYDVLHDRLYVTDFGQNRVLLFEGSSTWTAATTTAEPVRTLGNPTSTLTEMIQPSGIVIFP